MEICVPRAADDQRVAGLRDRCQRLPDAREVVGGLFPAPGMDAVRALGDVLTFKQAQEVLAQCPPVDVDDALAPSDRENTDRGRHAVPGSTHVARAVLVRDRFQRDIIEASLDEDTGEALALGALEFRTVACTVVEAPDIKETVVAGLD